MKRMSLNERFNDWLTRCQSKYNNKFDYTGVDYQSAIKKVCISCHFHGPFYISPYDHLNNKHGCKQCGIESMATQQRVATQEKFWSTIASIHNHQYEYTKTNFNLITDRIIVTCPTHGDFTLTVDHHLRGVGCAECGNLKRTGGYTDHWFNTSKERKLETGRIYLLKMHNENETFLKIGITKKSVKHRYRGCKYKYDILFDYECNLYDAFNLECNIKKISEHRYYPKLGDYKTESFRVEYEKSLLGILNEATVKLQEK
jgi:hypothetical protein